MGKLKLADIFQDSMVLQRDKPVYIWGQGESGRTLTLQIGDVKAVSKIENGCFFVELPPMRAERGLTMTVTTDQEEVPAIVLKDISIGDVYLAAGQSNMEYPLRYEAHFNELREETENPDIHMYNVPQIAYEGQERKLPAYGYWFMKDDSAWPSFSSIGYIFARYIQKETGVPIGIIGCNWGGTSAAAWIAEDYLMEEPLSVFRQEYEEAVKGWTKEELREKSEAGWDFVNSYRHQLEWRAVMYGLTLEEQKEWIEMHEGEPEIPMGPYHQWRPFGLYDTMVRKIAPYTVKGVLWYQGESDDIHGDIYDRTFQALTDCWRDVWKDPLLPFFTVQLAPFGKWMRCEGGLYPAVRKSQQRAAETIPNVYMTSIMDLGMYEDIHPKEKAEIARRLFLLVMQHLYGLPVRGESPEMTEMFRRGKQIIIVFKNVGDGLFINGCQLKALQIRQNHEEVPVSSISLHKDKLVFTCDGLTDQEIEVAFACEGYCEVNLYNSEGLSVKPFQGNV